MRIWIWVCLALWAGTAHAQDVFTNTGGIATLNQRTEHDLPAAGITVTEGIPDAATPAGPRSGILQYLSRKSRNRGADRLAEGSKYFLSEKGRLFAQLGRNSSLDSRQADYIVQTNVPGENRY